MAAPQGNQNARKAKIWEQAIKRALARYSGSTVDAGLDLLADRLVKAAITHEDDSAAAQIMEKIGDRLDGKPAQAIVGDADADPIQVQNIAIRLVKPDGA